MASYTTSVYQGREKSRFLSSLGRIRVCAIRFASTGVIYGNPYPACKKRLYNSQLKSYNIFAYIIFLVFAYLIKLYDVTNSHLIFKVMEPIEQF